MSNITIDKTALKRLAKDVREIIKNPLDENRIFYKHDQENILKGRALIIGPRGTPYENGNYLFEFNYPTNYPHSPPKVTIITNDGVTRMNPNLYRSGKVCISILNTWRGDQWSSCQTISSVLLTLCTVLCENPLLNEPNVKLTDKDLESYNKMVSYKNIAVGIGDVIEKSYYRTRFSDFREIICREFKKNYNEILKNIDGCLEYDYSIVKTDWYSSYNSIGIYVPHQVNLRYSDLRERIERIYKNIDP